MTSGEVLAEGFGFFFANTRLFFHLVTIPWIMSIAIRAIGARFAVFRRIVGLVRQRYEMGLKPKTCRKCSSLHHGSRGGGR